MAKKHIPTSRATEPPAMDNLQVIDGIGPAIERRLHSIGIFTFTQLAALSPADIAASVADIAGLTSERIVKQNWIGQAQDLATKHEDAQGQTETASHDTQVQSEIVFQHEEAVEQTHSKVATIPMTVKPDVKIKELTGVLHVRGLEMITDHPYEHRSIVRSNRTFKLRVTLDCRQVISSGASTLLNYHVSIYGRQLSADRHQKIGEAQGKIRVGEETPVQVEGVVNTQGFYRLKVTVALFRGLVSVPELIGMIEGGPLQFY